jgi:N-acetyltransferase
MEYVLSSAEDRSLHAKFHKQNSEGVEVGAAFVDGTMKETRFAGVTGRSADAVILVDSSDRKARTKKSQAVLEVVQRELGAVPIPEAELWERPKEAGSEWEPKYHSYLYIRGGKCIGYLLTQRIAEAFAVIIPPQAQTVPPDKRTKAGEDEDTSALARLKARRIAKEKERLHLEDAARQPIVLSTTKVAAVLGVSRIWTSPMHRGQGIALALLDTAVERHNSQLDPNGADATTSASKSTSRMTRIRDKRQVAFSQPTESGAKLARKWTGKSFGWSVYVD